MIPTNHRTCPCCSCLDSLRLSDQLEFGLRWRCLNCDETVTFAEVLAFEKEVL